MRPKEWGRSQSESVRKYRSQQKFLALKRSSLHFPLRRCLSRRTHGAPDFPTRGCDRRSASKDAWSALDHGVLLRSSEILGGGALARNAKVVFGGQR